MIEILAAALLQAAVPPQHVAAYSRLDTVSKYAAAGGVCDRFGYDVSADFPSTLQTRAIEEAVAAGVPQATAEAWVGETITRQVRLFQQSMDRTVAGVRDEDDPSRSINEFFDGLTGRCAEIAADPITFGLVRAGTAEELARTRQEAADELLQGFGKASWQTPVIWAKGELLFALGVCKERMPAARHDELLARHLRSGEERADAWLSGQYVDGLRNATVMDLDETQCGRLIRSRSTAAQ